MDVDVKSGLQFLIQLFALGSVAFGFILMGINRSIDNEQGGKGEGRMMASFYTAAAFSVAYVIVGLMNFSYAG